MEVRIASLQDSLPHNMKVNPQSPKLRKVDEEGGDKHVDLGGRQGKVGGKVVDKQEVGSSFVAGFVAA